MKLTRFIKGLIFMTITAVIYLHLQMNIFDLAYQGKVKEHAIQKIKDDNGVVTYQILKLKAAHNLGDRMLDEKSGLQFVSRDRVMDAVPVKTVKRKINAQSVKVDNSIALAKPKSTIRPSSR